MSDGGPGDGRAQSGAKRGDSEPRTLPQASVPDQDAPAQGHPAPDQQQLWAGNPWGARLISSADPVEPPEPYAVPKKTDRRGRRNRPGPRLVAARMLTPLVLAALALVLLLAAGVISFVVWRNAHPHHNRATQSPVTAADALAGYLDALAAGNADKAVGYLATKPASTALMTDGVLAASTKVAPITAIHVASVGPNARTVAASYRIGHQRVHSTFTAHRVHGRYLIDNGFLTVDTSTWSTELPLKINGVRLPGRRIYLLPGHYAVTVPSPYLGLGGGSGFTITGPQDVPAVAIQPQITAKGQHVFRKAVSAAIGGCLKSTKRQAGCGLDLPATTPTGQKIIDGTVRRQLSDTAKARLGSLAAFPMPSDQRKASASLGGGAVVTTATCEVRSKPAGKKTKVKRKPNSGKQCVISGSGTALATPVINVLSTKLTVGWQ